MDRSRWRVKSKVKLSIWQRRLSKWPRYAIVTSNPALVNLAALAGSTFARVGESFERGIWIWAYINRGSAFLFFAFAFLRISSNPQVPNRRTPSCERPSSPLLCSKLHSTIPGAIKVSLFVIVIHHIVMFDTIPTERFALAAVALLIIYLVYFVGLVIYRLFFSPIAKFPGPKLAAGTYLYEHYYDIVKRGKYTFKLKDLHARYGKSHDYHFVTFHAQS